MSTPESQSFSPERVESIFRLALSAPDLAGRLLVLERECRDNPSLRLAVESRLKASDGLAQSLRTLVSPGHPESPVPSTDDGLAMLLALLPPPTAPGTLARLGHYDLIEVVGNGGFGVVFRARDTLLARDVAIKMLSAPLAASSSARRRFLREARAAAAMRHDHVVAIHAVGESPLPHLVMDFIPGVSLQQFIDATGRLAPREWLWIGLQIARGLDAAHRAGLIHRDVKPGNVLLETGAESRARLTDFGLARSSEDESLTVSGSIAGTPLYMSPEQADGREIDARSDLFSLGSVLYTMAAGAPPFTASSLPAVLKHISDEYAPDIPDWMSAVIQRLLEKKPENRFLDAREVADTLADLLARLQPDGVAVSGGAPVPAPLRSPVYTSAGGPRRLTRVAGALVLAGVVVALVFSSGLLPQPGTTPAPAPAVADGRHLNALGMLFVTVPAGAMNLDGGPGEEADVPYVQDSPFQMGAHEVTQTQWREVMGEDSSPFADGGEKAELVAGLPADQRARLPMTGVSHSTASAFVARLNDRLAEPGWRYRLPTIREWEYACRGGAPLPPEETRFRFYFAQPANDITPDQANYGKARAHPLPVGSFSPNRLGLFDMHGNVFEICADTRPNEKGEILACFKGGAWIDEDDFLNARNTSMGVADGAYTGSGFRLVRVLVPINP
jgi:eukaryotic-like serine/threonine-protein kinase